MGSIHLSKLHDRLEVLFLVDRVRDGRRSPSRSPLDDTAELNDDDPVLIGLRALPVVRIGSPSANAW